MCWQALQGKGASVFFSSVVTSYSKKEGQTQKLAICSIVIVLSPFIP